MKKEDALNLLRLAATDADVALELLSLISVDRGAITHYRVMIARKLIREGMRRNEAREVLSRRFSISRRRAYEILERALNYA